MVVSNSAIWLVKYNGVLFSTATYSLMAKRLPQIELIFYMEIYSMMKS